MASIETTTALMSARKDRAKGSKKQLLALYVMRRRQARAIACRLYELGVEAPDDGALYDMGQDVLRSGAERRHAAWRKRAREVEAA